MASCAGPCAFACDGLRTGFVSTTNSSTYVEVRLDFGESDPFGPAGKTWLDLARAALAAASLRHNVQFSLAAGAAAEFDIVDKVCSTPVFDLFS